MTVKIEKQHDGIFVSGRIKVERKPEEKHLDPEELFQAIKSSGLNLDNVLSTYEAEARKHLSTRGFSTKPENTLKLYLTAKAEDLDAITVDLLTMLFMAGEVRANIAENDAAGAAWNAVMLCRAAERAEIRPLDLEKHLPISHKVVAGGGHGGKESGKVRREKAEPIKETWQAEADKEWRKHPTWGKPAVAKRVAEKLGGNPDTIRKTIKKPLP